MRNTNRLWRPLGKGLLKVSAILSLMMIVSAFLAQAQKLTTLHSFTGPTQGGSWPYSGLIQATDGNFYGITSSGGGGRCTFGCGTIFKITPEGTLTLTTIYKFAPSAGSYPHGANPAGVMQAADGRFYGTTTYGGTSAALMTSSLPAGIFTITASYSGDANFAASTSSGLRQTVNATTKSATATTLASGLNPSIYGQRITFRARVTTSGPVPHKLPMEISMERLSMVEVMESARSLKLSPARPMRD